MSTIDLCFALNKCDINTAFETLHSSITDCIDEVSPEKEIPVSTNHTHCEPWMSKGLRNCSKKQLALHKHLLVMKSITDCEKYKEYRIAFKKIKCRAKKDYYYNQCIEFKSNTKKLWQMVNNITGKVSNKRTIIDSLRIDSIEYTNRKAVSDQMCKYFSTIGHKFASKIPSSVVSIEDYNKKINKNSSTIFLAPTNHLEISNLIDSLPNKKSSGWDGISNMLLKSMKSILSQPLSILFNRSINEGVFLDIFKRADVIALHKSGLTDLPNN